MKESLLLRAARGKHPDRAFTPNRTELMSPPTSVLAELLAALPHLRPQTYFKASLTALSHAMEDRVLAGSDAPLVIASFQKDRYYQQEAHRYRRLARVTSDIYVLSAPGTKFKANECPYTTIAFDPDDPLAREWHLVVVGASDAACLVCRECPSERLDGVEEPVRRFEGIWTFERTVAIKAAEILLDRVLDYRPDARDRIAASRARLARPATAAPASPQPFVERLVTHIQAGQYKLVKAYSSLAAKERRERRLRAATAAIRRSLDPENVLQVAVEQLGDALDACRCIVYRCDDPKVATVRVERESRDETVPALAGERLPVRAHPPLHAALTDLNPAAVDDLPVDPRLPTAPLPELDGRTLPDWIDRAGIRAWLAVPLRYRGQLLGAIELHRCADGPPWEDEDAEFADAIAAQVSLALTHAEAYANLEDLNTQLAALEQTRSNLVAITGHELRTPLSTIQVCLESLANEPEMSPELRQVMLNTALTDAARMRDLVQDFLTLSRLESGRVEWNAEALALSECIELAISNTRSRHYKHQNLPELDFHLPAELPLVRADGEWLVDVLVKLLDNACKFTDNGGSVCVSATPRSESVQVTVADTGRGIDPAYLETVFDRFYQEEGALQRTTGGTGLGLAICRQIVDYWGGQIWAESAGRDAGTHVHFTVPICERDTRASEYSSSRQQRRRSGR